jgi:colicin import membrane protein
MSTLAWDERRDKGYGSSFALAFAMHAILLAALVFGVRFQNYVPETVSVELWEPPPAPKAEPKPEPPAPPPPLKPKPAPEPEPEPPKPEPKVEKPEIVEKVAPKPKPEPPKPKPEPPKPKPEPKPEPPKPKPKPEPPKPKEPPRDLQAEQRMREQLASEQSAVSERLAREAAARESTARALSAREKAMGAWISAIQNKIRGNINLPPEIAGNPEAIFDVALLPTGEILTVRMRKSSGHKGYDAAVERAILKSSPLPKPEPASLFVRELELRFRPRDQ